MRLLRHLRVKMEDDVTGGAWLHLPAYQALALISGGTYLKDGRRLLAEYLDACVVPSKHRPDAEASAAACRWDPIVLVCVSRLARQELAALAGKGNSVDLKALEALVLPALALYEHCRGPTAARLLLLPAEQAELRPHLHRLGSPAGIKKAAAPPRGIEGRWLALRNKWGRESAAIEEMLKLEGLEKVKDEALLLYSQINAERNVPKDKRIPQSLNFTFFGNPGTGKTTMARLFGQHLHELGCRPSDNFEETTGENAARMGPKDFSDLVDQADGGVLFIDEAHALCEGDPKSSKAVITVLQTAAENKRDSLTVILAGYKDEIESKLYASDPGFKSRFRSVNFEDFTMPELRTILKRRIEHYKWTLEDPRVVDVAARRVARGRGVKGFANARTCRTALERAYQAALDRGDTVQEFKTVDWLGAPPTPDTVPALAAALDELERKTGMSRIKHEVKQLVQIAQINYERELEGEPPIVMPLNRLFFGNPGTGKTTTAVIYGKILKGLGVLSDGTVELKQPADLMGSHVGETAQKTAALIDNCRGKVLLIDEAYALNDGTYGREALDTLVSKVHNAPGDDIAVIMCGYEEQIKKMLLDQNPGLQRRFPIASAFVFEDFSDQELREIMVRNAEVDRLVLPRGVADAAVKILAKQRAKPNFGNAGAVNPRAFFFDKAWNCGVCAMPCLGVLWINRVEHCCFSLVLSVCGSF